MNIRFDRMKANIESFNKERALQYDEESIFGRGDRNRQVEILEDILSFKECLPNQLIELGCGTGFFTQVLVSRYPTAHAVLFDASADMLNVARGKFAKHSNLVYIETFLQQIRWENIPKADIVFSSLTIHHLTDREKNSLYERIYENLNDDGQFIYFDQFKNEEDTGNELLEYLSCKDIQRRLLNYIGTDVVIPELEIGNIIEKDRVVKKGENDQEQDIGQAILALKRAKFSLVSTVYQEGRFYAIVAFK